MNGTSPKYYWDAPVWLGWLLEDFPEADMQGLHEVVAEADSGNAVIVTSTIVRGEVLPSTMDADARTRFEGFLKRSNVLEAAVDPRISTLMGELRDYYKVQKDAGKITKALGGMDAVHLATAIHYDVDEFHTFDSGGKGKQLGLLGLSGNVAGHTLIICKPRLGQRRLRGF